MNIEIDQSGKIEDTSKNTIIAFSNNMSKSIFISAKDKREIQDIFRRAGKSRIYVYKLFSILIFILVKKYIKNISQIIIDEEYPGKAHLIKNYIMKEIADIKEDFSKEDIIFKRIGKKSKAHSIAYLTFKRKMKPSINIKSKDILKFIIK